MPEYRLKTPALARKVVGIYRKIEQGTWLPTKDRGQIVDAFLEKMEMLRRKRMKKRRLMQQPG